VTCAACHQLIASSYYVVNGNVTCEPCRTHIVTEWNRSSPRGRFGKALGLGLVAAVLGAGLYFGIAALTGYEFGLVAVVLGLMVGGAVRKGSNGRGGRRYQLLAVFLTYTAVVVTDSSLIARELGKEITARADSARARDASPMATATAATAATSPHSATTRSPGRTVFLGLVGLVLLVLLAYAAPIVIGIANPMHLLIAAFALYEAWKLNHGGALRMTGPYRIGAGALAA
jgi:hypothetical protein